MAGNQSVLEAAASKNLVNCSLPTKLKITSKQRDSERWDRIEHGQLNASKQGYPCKATRPRSQNFSSKRVIKLSSPTAAKTTHTADGKHPARYSSHSRESATPYVRNKRGVRKYFV